MKNEPFLKAERNAQYKPHEDMKAFVLRVDQLMYQGKKNGKDRVCSEP